jgi:hypothetical protein
MSMTLEELIRHTNEISATLAEHRRRLPDIAPDDARHVQSVIIDLEIRVNDLGRECASLAAQRTSRLRPTA